MKTNLSKSMDAAARGLVMSFLRTAALTLAIGLTALGTATGANAGSNRLEVGLGAQVTQIDALGTESSVGIAGSLSYWRDGVGASRDLSLGVELLYLGDSSEDHTVQKGFIFRTEGTEEKEPTITALMLNMAWRRNDQETRLHPYAGIGAGVARVKYESSFKGRINGRPVSVLEEDEDTAFIMQAFLGVDYDLGEKWYVGAGLRVYRTSIEVLDAETDLVGLAVTAKLGVRF